MSRAAGAAGVAQAAVALPRTELLVDLERHVLIEMTTGTSPADLRRWTGNADPAWLGGIRVVATDLTESGFRVTVADLPGRREPGGE